MITHIIFRLTDGSQINVNHVLSFRFRKEAYTPYTSFSADFMSEEISPCNVTEILFYIDNRLIHHGTANSLKITDSAGIKKGTLYSENFTSLLNQNQLEPGLYTNTSVNRLMNNFIHIPYVTHEQSSESSYIYVKKGSVLWDGVVNLSYKLYNNYPYIRGTNHVMFSTPSEPENFSYSENDLLSIGSELTESRLSSHFHMADINEQYGTYNLEDTDVTERMIVRHRYFELDQQFLYDPQQALEYRDSFAARGWRRNFCSYSGYKGEDLYDTAAFSDISGRISAIEITGNHKGISTEISVYNDKFFA